MSHWRMTERLSGAPGIPQVEYVFCELPKLRGKKPGNDLKRWGGLFTAAPHLDARTVAEEPFTVEQRAALEPANEATFSEAELEAYRKARDEVQQMVQYGKDATTKGSSQGISQGLAPLIRLFERKLSRSLPEAERAALLARLDLVGPERLGDVVLDLDAAAVGAWAKTRPTP